MVREMIGGCCVCLDERGWNENPLVYCDGTGCTVAVHQACYGIVKVPSGPWFCCKCRSQERVARVKCELCPKKDGALKRTDTGGWAHVVCALYIPEVRFGDNSSMEPIIYSSVPHDRFMKNCYICDERNTESKSASGACMSCHKSGCKLSFHVTCAQSKRQLCEEAGANGHVQYVGYCQTHWQKRAKNLVTHGSIYGQIQDSDSAKKGSKDKRSRTRTESTSSTTSTDLSSVLKPSNRGRKPKTSLELNIKNDVKTQSQQQLDTTSSIPSSPLSSNAELTDDISPARGEDVPFNTVSSSKSKASMPNGQAKQNVNSNLTSPSSFSVNGILEKINSPLNTPVLSNSAVKDVDIKSQDTDDENHETSPENCSDTENGAATLTARVKDSSSSNSASNTNGKKRKQSEKDIRIRKKPKLKKPPQERKEKEAKTIKDTDTRTVKEKEKKKKEKTQEISKKKDKESGGKISEKKKKIPQPSQLGLLENGKVSSWDIGNSKLKDTPDNFQAFLEYQWNQSAQFITSKAQHCDVASLLGCLHQLKAENMKLEKKLSNLQSRKDRLLGLNARLASSFTPNNNDVPVDSKLPLSQMLSKLNGSTAPTPVDQESIRSGLNLNTSQATPATTPPEKRIKENDRAQVPSPDLAMLAATSAKFDNRVQYNHLRPGNKDHTPKNVQGKKTSPPVFQFSVSNNSHNENNTPSSSKTRHPSNVMFGNSNGPLVNGSIHSTNNFQPQSTDHTNHSG